jgi:arsenical pump membrane protein
VPDTLALVLALVVLAGTLAAAVSEASWASEAVVAVLGAALLVALGALSPTEAWDALGDLAPTAAFLAVLLVLAEACRRAGCSTRWGRGWRPGRTAARRGCSRSCSPSPPR